MRRRNLVQVDCLISTCAINQRVGGKHHVGTEWVAMDYLDLSVFPLLKIKIQHRFDAIFFFLP